MTTAQFRQLVRDSFPHLTVKVRTVSFEDLARDSAKCLTVEGARSSNELRQVNDWASQAGILPDTSLRFFAQPAAQPATATEGSV